MRITTARRIAQVFFLGLFVWLCLAATVGTEWWQWRGWPIALFLELDPLVALGTVLTTHSLHPGLALSLVTIALTLLLGRVFCGWVCPFGTIHQFTGWLARRGMRPKDRIEGNRHRPAAHAIKYYILIALLSAAAGNLLLFVIRESRDNQALGLAVVAIAVVALLWLVLRRVIVDWRRAVMAGGLLLVAWVGLAATLPADKAIVALLQTGLLDPIPLIHRSFNLAVLPVLGLAFDGWPGGGRLYTGAALIGGLFLLLVLLNFAVPRFYCRFLCPLGALLGVLGRTSPWGIGKSGVQCTECTVCDTNCEGACNPMGPIHLSECLMCMNCLDDCPTAVPIQYQPRPSQGGEIPAPGISRRGFVISAVSGLAAVPLARLGGTATTNWPAGQIRPPGSVGEEEFLARCVKCGECIRVCPTNVLQPDGFAHGWEGLWTPVLNNRIGTSGCQLNCIACGHACPTGAIRPLSLAEKHGVGAFEPAGPVRIGLAFVDQGRCLPWAMERPCIVCEENCPVTPKAIHVSEVFETVRNGRHVIGGVRGDALLLPGAGFEPGHFASGDYFCTIEDDPGRHPIVANTADSITLDDANGRDEPPAAGLGIDVKVRLQRPVVDPARCIGCGVCEHECPVTGLRAIRVTADNETRSAGRSVLLTARPQPQS